MSKANELNRLQEEMSEFFRYLKRSYILAYEKERSAKPRALLSWLRKVHKKEYARLKYAWELVPPYMWESYKHHRIRGLQEQGILASAVEDWKQIWSKRYADKVAEVPGNVPDQVKRPELQDHAGQVS